jgi:hypothetical protein
VAALDLRTQVAAALKRLVRDGNEWPLRDRRRFRNLLLDAASSDALPVVELLLRAHDDGFLTVFPDRSASRTAWDAATARLTGDLQTQRFLDSGVARFVAESWASALGPDVVTSPRTAPTRSAPARAAAMPRAPTRGATPPLPRVPSSMPASGATAASLKAYRRSNVLFLAVAALFTVLAILAFRSTSQRGVTPPAPAAVPVPNSISVPTVQPAAADPASDSVATTRVGRERSLRPMDSVAVPAPISPPVARAAVPVAAAPVRTTDDIVLNAGRVFEGKVLSVRQQSIVVKDEETGLDFEIAKADIDRIVTRDGRVMRFGDDNAPLLGDNSNLSAVSHAGRYRIRWTERWGAERDECRGMAHSFAPGTEIMVQHLRGAPMLRLAFTDGQGFNASVRGDGLFESSADVASVRGPRGAFVSTRLSGRFSGAAAVTGIARLTAVQSDGTVVCDLALTMRGVREP